MTKRCIYVAYTGGTIGMQKTKQGFAPVAGFLTECVKAMPEFYHEEMPDFVISEYSPLIDSSDMAPTDWQMIANDIKANYDKYDGFVILHGTDTMAYTASALSFMLQGLSKPVIVTGSQIPLAQLRSDGQTNLLNALILQQTIRLLRSVYSSTISYLEATAPPKPMPMVLMRLLHLTFHYYWKPE